jgi:hypothetical protein
VFVKISEMFWMDADILALPPESRIDRIKDRLAR